MDPDTGRYVGPTPMLGFGAGAYMVGLYNREAAALDCSTGIDQTCASILGGDTSDDTGTSGGGGSGSGDAGSDDDGDAATDEAGGDDKGCGCATASAPKIWLAIPIIGLALFRRRQCRPAS